MSLAPARCRVPVVLAIVFAVVAAVLFSGSAARAVGTDSFDDVATVGVQDMPGAIAIDTSRQRVYVANWLSNSVSVIDMESNEVLATVADIYQPLGITVVPTSGDVLVTNSINGQLITIDPETLTIDNTVTVSTESVNLYGVVSDAAGEFAYIADSTGPAVWRVDLATGDVVRVGDASWTSGPVTVALDEAGGYLYAAGSSGLWRFSLTDGTGTQLSTVALSGVAVDPATGVVYAVGTGSSGGNYVTVASDGTVTDTETTYPAWWISIDQVTGRQWISTGDNRGEDLANDVFTLTRGSDPASTVAVAVGRHPWGTAIDRETQTVYISNNIGWGQGAGSVSVISVVTSPTITSPAPAGTAEIDASYTATVTATGWPDPTLALTSGELPDGLHFDADTGIISGTPTIAGTYTFTLTATNGVDPDDSAAYTIVVAAAGGDSGGSGGSGSGDDGGSGGSGSGDDGGSGGAESSDAGDSAVSGGSVASTSDARLADTGADVLPGAVLGAATLLLGVAATLGVAWRRRSLTR